MGRNADAIAEGVSIADAAARLAVRNRILVDTIARNEPFDP
ncbi:MAG TPA: asparagine synthase, partial [Microbacterium sp.]|nr:asparagine synthase [Microbacterium sp.]